MTDINVWKEYKGIIEWSNPSVGSIYHNYHLFAIQNLITNEAASSIDTCRHVTNTIYLSLHHTTNCSAKMQIQFSSTTYIIPASVSISFLTSFPSVNALKQIFKSSICPCRSRKIFFIVKIFVLSFTFNEKFMYFQLINLNSSRILWLLAYQKCYKVVDVVLIVLLMLMVLFNSEVSLL
jgi:hypothetical protein